MARKRRRTGQGSFSNDSAAPTTSRTPGLMAGTLRVETRLASGIVGHDAPDRPCRPARRHWAHRAMFVPRDSTDRPGCTPSRGVPGSALDQGRPLGPPHQAVGPSARLLRATGRQRGAHRAMSGSDPGILGHDQIRPNRPGLAVGTTNEPELRSESVIVVEPTKHRASHDVDRAVPARGRGRSRQTGAALRYAFDGVACQRAD